MSLRLVQRGQVVLESGNLPLEPEGRAGHRGRALFDALWQVYRSRPGLCVCGSPVCWHFGLKNRFVSCAEVERTSEPCPQEQALSLKESEERHGA